VKLAPCMTLAVFTDGLLEVLPEPELDSKLERLKAYFGSRSVTVKAALSDLLPDARAALPDDVAILLIKRGADHGNCGCG
jgi:hypothetical protein